MARIVDSVEVNAPIHAVFAALTDPTRAGEWNPNIVDITDLAATPSGVGTSWTQVAMIAGKQARLNCRIVALSPPNDGVLDVTGDQTGSITTHCECVGELTRVTQTVDFTPPGGKFGAFAAGLIAPMLQREVHRALERARDTLEREALEASGSRPR